MPRAPLLWPSVATPSDEVAPIKNLYAHLTGLEYSVQAWEAALLLYQLSKNPPSTVSRAVASRWRFVACNECVLELYHLRCRIGKIRTVQLRNCPSLRAHIDSSRMRDAAKKLDEYFPDIEALRHAIAHKGENESHPEVHAPDGKYALTHLGDGDRFSTPYDGKLCHLDITYESLERINQITEEVLSAFEAAAVELRDQGYLD